jgi:uncharacterized Ntn-hydrolase superfamily protein
VRVDHTFSIVAYDPGARQWGVGVQTHWFGVGTAVPWVEGGVGAVATQSLTERSYGPLGLDLMRAGKSASEALHALLAADARAEVRQVAMVDSAGRVAAYTGASCIGMAGHRTGENFSVQANLMRRNTVWDAMAEAYQSSSGDLTERILVSLEAAEGEGGDIRGRQSASLMVAADAPAHQPWAARLVDVRVDDHAQPLAELRRLVTVASLYTRLDKATDALDARPVTEDGLGEARRLFEWVKKDLALIPGNAEPIVWFAVGLANAGRLDEALPLFREAFRIEPAWRDITPRLVQAGLLTVEAEEVRQIQGS